MQTALKMFLNPFVGHGSKMREMQKPEYNSGSIFVLLIHTIILTIVKRQV